MTITKEGALASFYTVNKAPIKHLKVYFSPKQNGSGDPSPENIRPIEGWNEINLYQYGKNLFDINTMANRPGVTINNNTIIGNARSIRYYHNNIVEPTFLFIPAGTTFIIHCTAYSEGNVSTEGAGLNPWFYYEDGTNVRPWYTRNSAITPTYYSGIITAEKNIVKYEWGWYNNPDNIWHISDLQFEVLSVPTKYESYHNVTSSINWSNDIGTIYGGYVDLITGKLVQEYESLSIPWKNWGSAENLGNNTRKAYSTLSAPIGGNASATSLCNLTNNYLWSNSQDNTHFYVANSSNTVYAILPNDLDENQEVQISYKLKNPIIYQLTPQGLQTFIGQNNIWSNADRVEVEYDLAESNDELYRRRNIILQGAPHLESVSGNIANFNTDLTAPIKDAKIYFEPIQEGSGDPSPENIRNITGFNEMNIYKASKNLLNPAYYSFSNTYESNGITFTHDGNGIITMNGTSNGEKSAQVTFSWTQPFDCDYYFCGNTSFGSSVGDVYIWDLTTLARPTQWDGVTTSKSSNVGLQEVKLLAGHRIQFCVRVYYINTTTLVNATAKPILVHKTCTDRTFESYQGNTIPITFPAVGKNLLDITKTSKINPGASGSNITISNGVISIDAVASSARSHVMFSQIFPPGTYTISAQYSGAVGCPKLLSTTEFNDSVYNTYYAAYTRSLNPQTNAWTFTLTVSSQLGIVLPNISNETGNPGSVYNIQVENGSTATVYEPYNNTIYGGYVDLISGKLVKEYDLVTFTWGQMTSADVLGNYERRAYNVSSSNFISASAGDLNNKPNRRFCNIAPWSWSYYADSLHYYVDKGYAYVFLPPNSDNNITIQIAILLNTPIEYQLTPQQLLTLRGTNNIWSTANGQTEIQYWTH